jgi:hypothetical protein
MTNPYAPPPIVTREDRNFQLESTFRSSTSFIKVGLVCALISGAILEITVANIPFIESLWALVLPGFVMGIGIFYATRENVPHARRLGLILFPFIAVSSFALLGVMYDSKIRVTFASSYQEYCLASLPGVLLLASGCLLIARPRSYSRFAAFVVVVTMVCGFGAYLAFNPSLFSVVVFRYLLIMLFAQAIMFGMVGWIFGDTISKPVVQSASLTQDSEERHA